MAVPMPAVGRLRPRSEPDRQIELDRAVLELWLVLRDLDRDGELALEDRSLLELLDTHPALLGRLP